MQDTSRARLLLEAVESAISPEWTLNELAAASESILAKWTELATSENGVVAAAVDLAAKDFEPAGHDDLHAVRRLCGVMMTLSLISLSSKDFDGMYKAAVGAIHLGVDILCDYDLSIDFCKRVAPAATRNAAWNVAILATGDMGIAFARANRYAEALLPLSDAIDLSLENEDYCSAARYGNELGRCYFELGEYDDCGRTFDTALDHAERCGDSDFDAQIRINIRLLQAQRQQAD